MEKVKTSISIDKNVYAKIPDIGEHEDRSFSQQVNKILKDFIADKEK